MKLLKISLIAIGSINLILLTACGNQNQVTKPAMSPVTSPVQTATPTQPISPTGTVEKPGHPSTSQGGQVIESGPYHLELVTLSEEKGTHLDFYLQTGDNHQSITTAKVMAQIQLPNGSQKQLDFSYDTAGKHYAALLPESMPGEYKIAVLSDINGKKVNGRFSFKR